ncbi:MAG: septum formation initiator family protein [Eubacterium pyruvativorans]|nr:septum formation initiator family protein [Eubacterium pyruvativorans]
MDTIRIVLIVLVLIIVFTVAASIRTIVKLKAEQAELKKQNLALRKQKAELQNEFRNVNNRNYIEEQARIQLNMIKPGEVLYILKDDKKNNKKAGENQQN